MSIKTANKNQASHNKNQNSLFSDVNQDGFKRGISEEYLNELNGPASMRDKSFLQTEYLKQI